MDRERYGSRGTSSRYPEPARPMPSQSQPPRRRDDRPVRQPQPQQRRGAVVTPRTGRDSSEPWSEVPPELEELLRAQLSTKLSRSADTDTGRSTEAVAPDAGDAVEAKAKPASRSRRKPAAAAAEAVAEGAFIETFTLDDAVAAPVEKAKPAPRSRRKPVEASAPAAVDAEVATAAEGTEPPAPKKRAPARRKPAAAAEAPAEGSEPTGE
jgi:ribonuclease E